MDITLPKRTDFTIKDAKRCFEGLSDGAVAKWRPKGLVSSTIVQRGTGSEHHFNIFGILHLGVLAQFSILGMLKHWQGIEVFIEPLEAAFPLTDPETICGGYAMLETMATCSVWIFENPIQGMYYRNRRAEVLYTVALHDDPLRDAMSLVTMRNGIMSFTSATIRIGMMLKRCCEILGSE